MPSIFDQQVALRFEELLMTAYLRHGDLKCVLGNGIRRPVGEFGENIYDCVVGLPPRHIEGYFNLL